MFKRTAFLLVAVVSVSCVSLAAFAGGDFTDDFEGSLINPELWVYGGAQRGWLRGGSTGSWNWSADEPVFHAGDPDGFLQLKADGPTSANTFGAEAWIRTAYDYNDGMRHIVNFTWDAEYGENDGPHYNHHLIQISDGDVPAAGTADLHWPMEGRPGTRDLLWNTDNQGNPRRGQFYDESYQGDLSKTTWSILIDPSGTAELYNEANGAGDLLGEEGLNAADPWYVRFLISDGTSSGFPAGDFRLNLYQVESASVPEPSTLVLFGLGTLGLVCIVRRRRVKCR